MRASASIVIERPIREVFALVTDVAYLDQWMEEVEDPQLLSDGRVGLGSAFTATHAHGRRAASVTYQVTVFDPPHRFAFKAVEGPLAFTGHVEFIGLGGTTQVHLIVETRSEHVGAKLAEAWFGPLLRVRLRRLLQQNLAALRQRLTPPVPARTYTLQPSHLAA